MNMPIGTQCQQVVACRVAAGMSGRQPLAPNAKCSVCNDEASGFHYGVDSCEGCKVSPLCRQSLTYRYQSIPVSIST